MVTLKKNNVSLFGRATTTIHKMIETRFKTELNKAPVILSFSHLVSVEVKKLIPKDAYGYRSSCA